MLLGCAETEREPLPFVTYPGFGGSAGTPSGGVPIFSVSGSGGSAQMVEPSCELDPAAAAPGPVEADVRQVLPSDGCGKPYVCAFRRRTLQTRGEKDTDCADELDGLRRCGAWSLQREAFIYLPDGYDPERPYPLVLEGVQCGARGDFSYALNATSGPNGSMIRVGISPPPSSIGHATNPGQGCFDDHEGDDSVDWTLYERLYDALNQELCFDRHRVFVGGLRSGATFANELACKYAGDALRPVRAELADGGIMPVESEFLPTCSQAPLAGMWVHGVNDVTIPFDNAKRAILRAMQLDHCTAADYDSAELENFPVGYGIPDDTCRRILGCDPVYPLVVCPLPYAVRGSNDFVVNPGFAAFASLLEMQLLRPSP